MKIRYVLNWAAAMCCLLLLTACPKDIEPEISLTVSTRSVTLDANNKATITITSNGKWTVRPMDSWLSPFPSSGTGNRDVSITGEPNTFNASREGKVEITDETGRNTITVSVTQNPSSTPTPGEQPAYNVNVSTASLSFANNGGTDSFTIDSNDEWSVKQSDNTNSWLTVTPSGNTVTVTARANETVTEREATITVTGKNSGVSKEVKVTQAAGLATPTPSGSGNGTADSPYNVAGAMAAGSGTGVYVKAYIVGNVEGQVLATGAKFGTDGDSQTNILIAASPDETNVENCMPVQLPTGDIRSAINLKDNPGNYKKEVTLYGNIEKYFGATGIKSVSFAIFNGREIGSKPDGGGGNVTPADKEGLVAYYPFNGNANDESGNGNHGTIIGHVELAPDRFGNANSAYQFFNEPLNYISVADNESLHLSTFTLNAWVYTDGEDYGNGYLINKGRDINDGSYRLYVNGVCAQVLYGGTNDARIDNIPETKVWHMVTGTVEGDQAKFYLDGVLMDEKTLSHPFSSSNTDPLSLGMHYFEGVPSFWAYPLLGVLDDVRIYNRVLNSSEINALYKKH